MQAIVDPSVSTRPLVTQPQAIVVPAVAAPPLATQATVDPAVATRSIVTRFAPSPTGWLHLGHAASALFAWRHAREAGGRFLLRLEDIDPTRCRPEYAAAILEDLAWLGIDWDGPVRVQSAHLDEYQGTLDSLVERGLVYPCFCSRAAIQREAAEAVAAPHAPDGSLRYPGTCRSLPAAERALRLAGGEPHVLRLDVAAALAQVPGPLSFVDATAGRVVCDPAQFGDVVLARRDAPASYHLCVTHDDALQGITLVTRGVDLLPATQLHRLLQALMGWPEPAYAHHPLLTDAQGRRLAKRDRAATLRALREEGVEPAQVRSMAGFQ
jgi:glutamyl-Q tRNA(Asp) synthetase